MRRTVAAVLVGQTHPTAAADFGDGVDGGIGFGTEGIEDVLERKAFWGREVR